jgi:TPR repeat protein
VRRSFQSFGIGLFQAVLALWICAAFSITAQASGKRVAFVVGNGAYQSVPQLPNPRNDADLVSKALRRQGFEVVTAIDLTRVELEKAVERYARSLNGADISLFYYSGHGIEVGGENRIVPVDATLNAPEELETQTFSLQTIMLYMQSNSKAQLIYMDACRDNPFSNRAFLTGIDDTEKKAGKGLAEQKGAIGSLIAYAAAPGQVALDGKGQNSPFTDAVLRHSFSQGTDVQNALMKVTEEVWQATNKEQRPWVNSTLVKPVFLNGLFVQTVASNSSSLTLASLQTGAPVSNVLAGPVVVGAGAQNVFAGEAANALPNAASYKLMQLPLTGTLSVNGLSLAEGTVLDAAQTKSIKFEPSTEVPITPAVLHLAAIAANGAASAAQITIQQVVNECDLQAGEPLDLQGIGKGIDLEDIDAAVAVIVCQNAAADYPDVPRYVHQLGRAKLAGKDYAEAQKLFKFAADAGHVRSLNQLGDMALNGLGRDKNPAEANAFFKQAADKGDPYGLLSFGRNLAKGVGLKADVKQGIELLKRSAEMGNTEALDEMGALYLYGGALKANPKRAAGFMEASVKRSVKKGTRNRGLAYGGNPNAPTDLGAMYFNGNGVRKDLKLARRWYELGAESGNQGGTADLSWIYAQGPDDLRNPERAVWFTSLALATDAFRGNEELLRRLSLLPDDAKRSAMRDFINMVGPCATSTTDGLDDTLLLLSNKAWLHQQALAGDLRLPTSDGSFAPPNGTDMAEELRYWNLVDKANEDQAYLAYLENFPDGVFADIARGKLGGLLERVKFEPREEACEPPKNEKKKPQVKVKPPVKKIEPVKVRQEIPKIKKLPPKRPPPVVEKPKKKPPPKIRSPKQRPPKVRPPRDDPPEIEEEPEFEPEREPDPEVGQQRPDIDLRDLRRKLKLLRKKRRPVG